MKGLHFILAFALCSCLLSCANDVHIGVMEDSLQTKYAVRKIREALATADKKILNELSNYEIILGMDSIQLRKEAYKQTIEKNKITITGGDGVGLIYGSLGLVEDIKNGVSPSEFANREESANYPFRAIKFDLPWDTYRHSLALDLHYETCKDLAYWEKFLDMMVENRFNSLTLWNLHPYTFMIKPKNFPEASPFTDSEMQEWQSLFKGIFAMAEERGIDTYIFPFNIFVSPEFAKAHHVAMDNLEHHFFVNGDTSAIIKQYTKECVAQMLQEYPTLDGLGLTLGEGMKWPT